MPVKNQPHPIRAFLLEKIPQYPRNIVALASKEFSVSRTTVHRHLNRLERDGKIIKTGTTKQAAYFLKTSLDKTLIFNRDTGAVGKEIWSQYLAADFSRLKPAQIEICAYGFAQAFDNACLHSESKGIVVKTVWKENSVELNVIDDGVGLFEKIRNEQGLADKRESVLPLAHGVLRWNPENPPGLLTVSRAFDMFGVLANGLFYFKDNRNDDWFLESKPKARSKGTRVSMALHFDSVRTLSAVLPQPRATAETERRSAEVRIALGRFDEEPYVSRIQAQRLLKGMDRFQRVVLDFTGITTVGQAFVDEVFRVYAADNPDTRLDVIHANEDVRFMIQHGTPQSEALSVDS